MVAANRYEDGMPETVLELPLDSIFSDEEFNSRGHITPMSVTELARDLEKNGLMQPILVQPWNVDGKRWRIVCGHRRYLATKLLATQNPKFATIKALVRDNLSEAQALVLNLSENIKRKDLNIVQEARAISRFKRWGWSQHRVAEELGVPRPWVQVRFAVLELPEEIQKRAEAGFLTQHQILDIYGLPDVEAQMAATRRAVDHKLKGERGSLKVKPKKKNPFKVGVIKTKEELFAMQEHIQDSLEDNRNFGARCIAWAGGIISDYDLFKDLQQLCMDKGLPYSVSKQLKS